MIDSRNLADLHPVVRQKAEAMIAACEAEGVRIVVTSTYRDAECQDALFARGRTAPGPKVTNARAGESWHNYRLAFDVVPLRNGKPVWGTAGADGELWKSIGEIGKSLGLEWAGEWTRFREFPHFQWTGGLTLADLKAGKLPAETAVA